MWERHAEERDVDRDARHALHEGGDLVSRRVAVCKCTTARKAPEAVAQLREFGQELVAGHVLHEARVHVSGRVGCVRERDDRVLQLQWQLTPHGVVRMCRHKCKILTGRDASSRNA